MQKLTKFRALQYTLTNGTNALDFGNLDYLSCVFPRGCHLIIICVLHIRGIYARKMGALFETLFLCISSLVAVTKPTKTAWNWKV